VIVRTVLTTRFPSDDPSSSAAPHAATSAQFHADQGSRDGLGKTSSKPAGGAARSPLCPIPTTSPVVRSTAAAVAVGSLPCNSPAALAARRAAASFWAAVKAVSSGATQNLSYRSILTQSVNPPLSDQFLNCQLHGFPRDLPHHYKIPFKEQWTLF
jgi:hypothetical protein